MFKSIFRGMPGAEESDPDVKPAKRKRKHNPLETGIAFIWTGPVGFGFGYKEFVLISALPEIKAAFIENPSPEDFVVLSDKECEVWFRKPGETYYLVERTN